MNDVKCGFGKVDITPRAGVELAGYGPFLDRRANRVLEPLFARALAVESNAGRWVIVSCDLMSVSAGIAGSVRRKVAETTGWNDAEIAVHATHSHSGPCATPELIGWGQPDPLYIELLPRYLVSACIDAIRDLKASEFKYSEVPADGFGYNRMQPSPGRSNLAVLKGSWHPGELRETDTMAHVISVESEGRVRGFLTYFSCHPVVCGGLCREIHGDFVGVAVNHVERLIPGSIGVFLQGAMGDIDSVYSHGPPAESLVALDHFGTRFAKVIVDGLARAERFDPFPTLARLSEHPYTLPIPEIATLDAMIDSNLRTLSTARIQAPTEGDRLAMVLVLSLRNTIWRLRNHEPVYRALIVQALRLGPLTITSANMELFHSIKRRFQSEFGSQALVLSLTNGDVGYAAAAEAYHLSPDVDPTSVAFMGGESPPYEYAAYLNPYLIGYVPFASNIADEVLAGLRAVTRRVLAEPVAGT